MTRGKSSILLIWIRSMMTDTWHRERQPWFDTRLSYNPAVHRTKQALFHGACVEDLNAYPVPDPHPDLLKYFDPPRGVVKRAKQAVEDCKQAFKVKEGPLHSVCFAYTSLIPNYLFCPRRLQCRNTKPLESGKTGMLSRRTKMKIYF